MVYKLYDLTCLRVLTHRQATEEIAIGGGKEYYWNNTWQAANKQLEAIEILPGAISREIFDFEKSFINRTVKKARDIDIYLASVDDIIKMKEFSGRTQDLSDIEMLKKVRKYMGEKNG
ncbi:MAG: hypothetical protein U0586_13230 [Candidatus Brocadiaceae bacterium]